MAKTKVSIEGISRLKGNIKELFDQTRKDAQMLVEVGEKTVELTKQFNRAGHSPSGKKHPKNSVAWEERKKKLTKTNQPSEYYRAGLSNVTFTGQLIDSIKLLRINKEDGSVTIDATGQRTPYKNLNGKPVSKKNTPTNPKLVEYLADKGRKVFGINKQMTNVINRIVRKYLNERIKKTFK
jgi:hypothetical protein